MFILFMNYLLFGLHELTNWTSCNLSPSKHSMLLNSIMCCFPEMSCDRKAFRTQLKKRVGNDNMIHAFGKLGKHLIKIDKNIRKNISRYLKNADLKMSIPFLCHYCSVCELHLCHHVCLLPSSTLLVWCFCQRCCFPYSTQPLNHLRKQHSFLKKHLPFLSYTMPAIKGKWANKNLHTYLTSPKDSNNVSQNDDKWEKDFTILSS